MRVVGRLVFGEDAAPVGRDDRVQIRPLVRPGVLRDEGGASAVRNTAIVPAFASWRIVKPFAAAGAVVCGVLL